MGPEDVGARLAELIPGATASVSGGGAHARATVDVPADAWVAAKLVAWAVAVFGYAWHGAPTVGLPTVTVRLAPGARSPKVQLRV